MAATPERLVIEPAGRRRARAGVSSAPRAGASCCRFSGATTLVVLQALAGAAARGVAVSAIVTARASAAARDLDRVYDWLDRARHRGAPLRRARRSITRNTWSPTSGSRSSPSLNYTAKCFARTCDFLLVTRDPAVVSGLTALFDADWAGQPASLTAAQRERLIVGPDGDPRARFASDSCTRRGSGSACSTPSSPIRPSGALLDDRRGAGVEVEIARRRTLRPLRAPRQAPPDRRPCGARRQPRAVAGFARSPARAGRRRARPAPGRRARTRSGTRTATRRSTATGLGTPASAAELAS